MSLAAIRAAGAPKSCWCAAGCEGFQSLTDNRVRSERDAAAKFLALNGPMEVYRELTAKRAEAGEPFVVVATITSLDEWDAFIGGKRIGVKAAKGAARQSTEPVEHDPRNVEAQAFLEAYRGRSEFILALRGDRARGTKWFRLTDPMVDAILRVRDAEVARPAATAAWLAETPRAADAVAWLRANDQGNDFATSVYEKFRQYGTLTPGQMTAILRSVDRDQMSRAPATAPAPAGTPPTGEPAKGPGGDRQSPSRPVEQDGWYKVGDDIFKVQKAVHGSGNLYAKMLVVNEGVGAWEYAPGDGPPAHRRSAPLPRRRRRLRPALRGLWSLRQDPHRRAQHRGRHRAGVRWEAVMTEFGPWTTRERGMPFCDHYATTADGTRCERCGMTRLVLHIPEWRRRALEQAAKEGRLVAVKDTTGSVL